MFKKYDIIVVGAGHAGCEAAAAAANMGSSVLLITMNMQTIGQMSCNPAMGGVAKGQIVREIDALGGYSGIITDKSMIQFRMLNRSKGPAMWSPRAQNDRMLFSSEWRYKLEQTPNIDFWQDMVRALVVNNKQVQGVITGMGQTIYAKAVVLTNGTFLNGIIHVGQKQFGGGRMAEKAATGITEQLVSLGFETGRMKTGTPPRVDGRSLNYNLMEIQPGDENPEKFSFSDETQILPLHQQRPCHITYTNAQVHEILRTGFDESPMFTGRIKGLGPRYCPSIEDKIERFAERDRHQIFVEPEGWNTIEIYVNGFSTSLPEEVQYKAITKIPGFENAKLFRPGYAIEYDYFPPVQLYHTLETKLVDNLYFAGQINGTTGYEEAACQGLMAGINAHLKIKEQNALILTRDQAYIGVLIDDLINKGTEEPYRMFTSRAEYRLLLRQDNADLRLTPIGYQIGLASQQRINAVQNRVNQSAALVNYLTENSIAPDAINTIIEQKGGSPLRQKSKLLQILLRPEITLSDLLKIPQIATDLQDIDPKTAETTETNLKYESYIAKERELANKMQRLENIRLNPNFDYFKISALSNEAKDKLSKIKPLSLGQASRISGVSPADISVLLVQLGR
ncbi:MAG: tRNA uridine-5-carboxymethylaminomethyl(34) synthesis enzyme MnmG [Sphingobacteriales bacterium]|jgi:tRNA uridine 5-carboxymethylaminomethyl modification enzyme|nr:tRNA uridine-5-carboxymethylaminomethyl(34) synthesis enzyme MnmG [Sphingobacteriales bacterium]MBP9140694.1 tRNA uridine-5-carboxymethylaminomethyl(34) synthesis enzyme MnmG [Chitinophagales bacterium]MBK7526395.1 tRNA uridine-5-carboxymethylaminomethyl(34) synthesis enzyme MnmG [Sphingobacteriales bacterium]MBK8680046.1 tRNA uridine-5-carboxymethylaminomethyl(34) synthesis enzyme MnmG [Sphingobacteriales bacterium]MBL0247589.1 tRNA uridine-5-carboxymethylaminomethyl(34) synthesis enzyme Mn